MRFHLSLKDLKLQLKLKAEVDLHRGTLVVLIGTKIKEIGHLLIMMNCSKDMHRNIVSTITLLTDDDFDNTQTANNFYILLSNIFLLERDAFKYQIP